MKYEFADPSWLDEAPESDPDHAEIEQRLRASILELIESRRNFLGEGKTAEVHFLPDNPRLCYKIIRRTEVLSTPENAHKIPQKYQAAYRKSAASRHGPRRIDDPEPTPWHLDLAEEGRVMAKLKDLSGRARVPKPIATLEISGVEEGDGYEAHESLSALVMETLDAVSVEDILSLKASLPDGFDMSAFGRDMRAFIAEMHSRSVYHRDLHEGNVMISRSGDGLYVIDFGRSAWAVSEEDAYEEEFVDGRKERFLKDEPTFHARVEKPLRAMFDK